MALPLLLLLLGAVTLAAGQTSVCYSSLDCHGNQLDVVVPDKSGASAFASECCSAEVRGLSYSQAGGEECLNCYTTDDFESYGDKFYLGVFGNFQPPQSFQIEKVRLSVSPVAVEETEFTVELQGKQNKYTAPTEVQLKADDVTLDSEKTRDKAIIVESEDGDALSVVAFAEEFSSSDTFRVMPCVRLPDKGYEYYAMSVPRARLTFRSFDGEEIVSPAQGKSALVIVTTEANTVISITLTQDITNVDANDIMDQIGGGDTLSAGVEYSLKFTKSKQTLYLASVDDLTGSRVVSNKPIAFFSGHECGTVPFNIHYCDHLAEQLPPAATWGKRFITAPIASRSAVDVFRIVASRNSTTVQSSCFEGAIVLNAGEFREFNISSSSYCYFESNQPLLMVQFSVASDLDGVLAGDPFMVVVPPVEQYRNNYNISTFVSSSEGNPGMNYINILVPADSGSSEQVRWDGQRLPSSVQFVEIRCVSSETICAYAAQMNISAVSHILSTANSTAKVNAIVYWLSFRVGHGYFAGMTQRPISLPMISLDQQTYEELENNSLAVTVLRKGDSTLPVTVYLTTTPIQGDNAAIVNEDFVPVTKELVLRGDSGTVFLDFIDDVFPERAEEFEVFLSAAPGGLVVPPAYATVNILNDDPPLPVMNISFITTKIEVMEGMGMVTLMLEKTEGAIGPVSIRIFTVEGTANDGDDFVAVNDTITFGVEDTKMEMLIFILDNSALEEVEQFTAKIEAISGDYPVAVMNSTATVVVTDNDVVVLGFSQLDYTTDERPQHEGLEVSVDVLFGQLERSVAVWINSTQESTATPGQDFEGVSRVLTFDAERSQGAVRVVIFDDVEREVALETVHLQLSFVEEERNNTLLLLPRKAVVTIMDADVVEVGLIAVRGTVREGEGSARVNISILQGTLGDASISFIVFTTNGSAAGNTDYVRTEVKVSLSDRNPFEELVIPIIDDNEYEGSRDEVFFVQAQLNPNGQDTERVRIAADLASVTVNIIDNEVKPVASVGFVQQTWRVSEDNREVTLLVESDGRNVDPVSLEYSFQNASETAEDQVDFLVGKGVLLFSPRATLAAIVVPIINDESAEPTEFFNINLLPASDISLTTDLATVFIDDNDAVVVRFSMTSYTVNEAAGLLEVAVQISGVTDTVQVNISSVDGTAEAGLDYLAREMRLTFSPGDFEKRVSIHLIDDRIGEGQELLFLSLHSPVSSLMVELPPNSVIFIVDDDTVITPLEPSLSVTTITTTSAVLRWTSEPVTRFLLNWTYVGPCNPQLSQSVIIDGGERNFTIRGLEEGGSYTFGLTPFNVVETGPNSTTMGQTLTAVPTGAPNNIQATNITENGISIKWDEIDCLDQNGAIIQYDLTLNGTPSSSTNDTKFSFTGLSPQTQYNITVIGVNRVGSGPGGSIVVQTVGRKVQSVCRASTNCGDPVDLGEKTIEECCLNTPNGLAISEGEVCTPCIVFGFFNDSFVGVEQGQGYSVQVGYLKGASVGTNLFFNVKNTPNTAREGAQFDYTVSTTFLRVLSSRPDPPEEVSFILRADSIAQEENETLTLELEPTRTIPAGRNVFFKSTIRLTIIDSDEVGIFFTDDDFRASERNSTNPNEPAFMPVLVTKNSRIANPIVLDVIPLTVGMARANANPLLPDNIPPDNPFSPPFADLNDFNNTTKRITFDPDEDANDNERAAPIHIFNDAVNEADEQVFVVQLHLINSTDPGSVILDERPTSLCRIVDDDTISIGFELLRYTYMEPKFDTQIDDTFVSPTNLTSNGPIYVAKEDNVQSEQTFRIIVQAADSVPPNTQNINPATIRTDYSTGGLHTSTVVDFRPAVQRVNFRFTLFPDTFPEGTEAFRLSSSAEDTAEVGGIEIDLPDYLPPRNLHAETFVLIEDDDPIIIGFIVENYTVSESMGMLQVNVSVISPPVGEELFATIDLVVQSVTITATGGADYEELDINSPDYDVFLRFDDMNRWQIFDVTINDDDLLEYTEDFNLELRFDPFVIPPSIVELSPNVSTVYIQDDDNVTIGFTDPPYSVDENDGQVLIPVGVLNGALQREVVVSFSTSDSTAIDGTDYNQVQSMLLTFGPTSIRIDVPVTIMNNDVFELTEAFSGILSFPGNPVPRVALSPASTEVIILDDDELSFGFQPDTYSVNEGAGPAILRIVFSGDVGEFVPHVITSTIDGTATGSGDEADYTHVVAQAFSFTNSDRNRDLSIDIISDAFTEDNEIFFVKLDSLFLATQANGQALTLSDQERARLIRDPDTASVTILDDEVTVVGFLNPVLNVSEDDGALGFDVGVISGILRINVTVNFITNDGDARAGQDYFQTATSLILIDQSLESVPVFIIDDDLFETPENFVGLLSNGSELPPNVQLAPTRATATILDTDMIIIGFDPDVYEINENGGTVTLTVKVLNGTISEQSNIRIRVTTVDDSAQAPGEYTDILNEMTFSSGSTEHTVVVNIVDDNILETDKVFTAILEFVNGIDAARVVLHPVEASVTILDNDAAVIGFDSIMYNVTEGVDKSLNLNVGLISGVLGHQVRVLLNTQSRTATSGLDFGGITSLQLVFSPTTVTVEVSVGILDDNFLESPMEIFTANLTSNVPRLSLSPDKATVNVADNDNVTFGFDRAQYQVFENASFVTVTIRQVSGAILNRTVHITLTTGDGTAISSGERDFVAHSVDLTFGPGNTEQNVMIAIIDDLRLEHDEQFNSVVSHTVADPSLHLKPADASIIITDDVKLVVIGFNQTLYEVREDVGQAVVYVVVRNGILRRQVVVEVSTADNTALNGSDYTGVVPRLLTFGTNNSEFPIAIDILNDSSIETNETFFCHLSTKDEDAIVEPGQTTVRILDDDDKRGMVRLVDGNNDREGRVEIYIDGEWGTVCDDEWDVLDALVVCKQLGLGEIPEAVILTFPSGSGKIFLDNVQCTGEEQRLIDCPANDIEDHNCEHSEDAGVRCLATAECTDRQARLVSDQSTNSTNGRLEVCAFGRWGTVCDDQFDSTDAMVVCRQLGLSGGVARFDYPDGTGIIWLDDVDCAGSEVNIFDCNAAPIGVSNCGHSEDVGVMCQP